MDLNNYQTNNPNELIAKLGKVQDRIIFTLVLSLVFAGGAYLLFKMPQHLPASGKDNSLVNQLIIIASLVYLGLLPPILAFWSMVFDRKIKLLINEKGVGYSTNLLTQCQNNYYKWFMGINKSTINGDGIGYEQAFFEWNNLSSYQVVLSKKQFGIDYYKLILKPKYAVEPVIIDINTLDKPAGIIQLRLDSFSNKEAVVAAPVVPVMPAVSVVPELKVDEKPVDNDIEVLVDSMAKMFPKQIDRDVIFVARKKQLSKQKFIIIYLLAFIVGFPVSYAMFKDGYQNSSSNSYVFSALSYCASMYFLTKKYTKVKLKISRNSIADETTVHQWEDISSFQFQRATKVFGLNERKHKEIVLDSLVLVDKEGKEHFMDVTESGTDKSIDEIKAAIKEATKGLEIEDLGFVHVK